MGREPEARTRSRMPTDHAKALIDALKIAKASKNGLPMQIQQAVNEIASSSDPQTQGKRANEVTRWLYAESNQPGIDQFTVMGYTALRNALEPFIQR